MKTNEIVPNFKVGDTIRWASQAGGTAKMKRGRVIAILASNGDLHGAVPKGTKPSHVMGSGRSLNVRYVVEVPYAGKATKRDAPRHPRYYAPLVSTIDGDSDSRGHLEKVVAS